jgi:hypothetical protein
MRSPRRSLVACLSAFLALLAVSRSAAAGSEADSEYGSYRIPDHRWWQSSADLGLTASHNDVGWPAGSRSRLGSFAGNLTARANWGFDSDPSALSWSLGADVRGDRRHQESAVLDPFQEASSENGDRSLVQSFSAQGSWRRYPWASPVGVTLGSWHNLALSQRFSSGGSTRIRPTQTEHTLHSSGQGEWSYQGSLSAGVGLGRVRDVTPVYQAQVMEDRLRRTGALSRALTPGARYRLASLLATRGGPGYAHQRPDKYFWEALERVLRDDGALERGTLDGYSAHRVLEPVVPAGKVFRRAGWFAGPAVAVGTLRTHRSLEEASSYVLVVGGTPTVSTGFRADTEQTDRRDDILTAFVAEAHRPVGLRWQLDASHSTQAGDSGRYVSAATSLGATWAVSDRWIGGVSARHAVLATGRGSARGVDTWDVGLAAELHYFLEDSWTLGLRGSEVQNHRRNAFSRGGQYSLSITRLFSGYFELPGVAAMRLTPPAP